VTGNIDQSQKHVNREGIKDEIWEHHHTVTLIRSNVYINKHIIEKPRFPELLAGRKSISRFVLPCRQNLVCSLNLSYKTFHMIMSSIRKFTFI